MSSMKNTVYLVQTGTYLFRNGVACDTVYRTCGVYTDKAEAERIAHTYDDYATTGFVTEIELNKEYDQR